MLKLSRFVAFALGCTAVATTVSAHAGPDGGPGFPAIPGNQIKFNLFETPFPAGEANTKDLNIGNSLPPEESATGTSF